MVFPLLGVTLLSLLWIGLGRAVERFRISRVRKLTIWVVALRGAVLGLAIAIFLAVGITQASRARSPYYFQAIVCATCMLCVPFSCMGAVLGNLRNP